MSERELFFPLLYGWIGLAAVVLPLLFRVSAPYGRHARRGWGPQLPRTVGWIVMEAPAPLWFLALFLLGSRRGPAELAFLALWLLHYLHRAFVYPLRLRGGQHRMPALVVLLALVFNLGNGYFNGRYLFALGPPHEISWLLDPRFVVGAAMFVLGFAINLHADSVLLRLRASGEPGYKIPQGGLYELISCPNYFGEVVEWSGWALCTWSLPGLAFALWTGANLIPRAHAHHRWYRERFPEYPHRRRAVIPYVF